MKPLKTVFFKNGIIPIGCTILLLGAGGGIQIGSGEEQDSGNSSPNHTQIAAKKQPRETVKRGPSFRLPVYKPPKGIGAPGGRIGGATRGQDALAIFALVPDHLGLTINEQPILYWYLSKPVQYPLILTVNDETQVKPVVETIISNTPRAGIHSAPLKNFNLKRALDREYQWFVSLAIDEENPSKNIIAGGRIQRISPPEKLLRQLRNAEPDQVTAIYSEAGLWYDALASISDLIESHPDHTDYRVGRKTLLEQVDLMEVAEAEENLTLSQESSLWSSPQAQSLFTTYPKKTEEVK
ncbi:MAG: DUF928 domain-containing protein [Nitrospirales bacterium]|nr:DUF928 domain-containing protein [Nitrospirales bacterium]